MTTAKLFNNGACQAVRLPKEYRLTPDENNEVLIRRFGDMVMLIPKDSAWKTFLEGIHGFTDDLFPNGREQGQQTERESL